VVPVQPASPLIVRAEPEQRGVPLENLRNVLFALATGGRGWISRPDEGFLDWRGPMTNRLMAAFRSLTVPRLEAIVKVG
jgi:hypothetical protein